MYTLPPTQPRPESLTVRAALHRSAAAAMSVCMLAFWIAVFAQHEPQRQRVAPVAAAASCVGPHAAPRIVLSAPQEPAHPF